MASKMTFKQVRPGVWLGYRDGYSIPLVEINQYTAGGWRRAVLYYLGDGPRSAPIRCQNITEAKRLAREATL